MRLDAFSQLLPVLRFCEIDIFLAQESAYRFSSDFSASVSTGRSSPNEAGRRRKEDEARLVSDRPVALRIPGKIFPKGPTQVR